MCLMHVVGGVALRDLDPGRAFIGTNLSRRFSRSERVRRAKIGPLSAR